MNFRRRHLIVGLMAVCAVAAWLDFRWLQTYHYAVAAPDFFVYYLAAQVGRLHGWSAMYDPTIFLPLERAVVARPLPYLNSPELAWLVLPLSWLPYAIAAWLWKVLLLSAAAITWWLAAPSRGFFKGLYGILAAVSLPTIASFVFGQVSIAIVATIAIAWWLTLRQQPWLAGAALALAMLKPQLAFLVPPALMLSGFGRVFISWLLGTAVLITAALVATGPSVFQHLAGSLSLAGGEPGPVQLSLLHQLPWPIGIPGICLALLVCSLIILRQRHDATVAFASALLTGILVSPYINFYDLPTAVLAGWLLLRLEPRPWYRLVVFAGYLPLYLAPIWPLATIFAVAVWLAGLLGPWRTLEVGRDQSATQAGAAAA